MRILPAPWRRRFWTCIKWLAIIVAVVLIADWITGYVVGAGNQRKIDGFYERVGARSLTELAGVYGPDKVHGNGWYPLLAALSCISPETSKALFAMEEQGGEMTPDQISARERELDLAHGFLERAAAAPFRVAILHYADPLRMKLPPIHPGRKFVRLACASARECMKDGNPVKAGERLADALLVSSELCRQPSFISYIVTVVYQETLLRRLGGLLQGLPEDRLGRFAKKLAEIDFDQRLFQAFVGDVFLALAIWEAVKAPGGDRILGIDFPLVCRWLYCGAVEELDRSVYLGLMLPLIEDPTAERAKAITRDAVPFYAPLTRVLIFKADSVFTAHHGAETRLAVVREALRLELEHRRQGTWPDPRGEVDGVAIVVTASEDTITLSVPRPADADPDHEPFAITLKK